MAAQCVIQKLVGQAVCECQGISTCLFSSIRWRWWSGCDDQRTAGYSNKVAAPWYQHLSPVHGFVFFLPSMYYYSSPGQQCRRMEVMFCIGVLKTALLNWSCRDLAPVVQVPLLLWRVESKTCCSFTSLKLNQWSRFVSPALHTCQ